MLRRLIALFAAVALGGLLGAAPAAADEITVGPITIDGNPGCC